MDKHVAPVDEDVNHHLSFSFVAQEWN